MNISLKVLIAGFILLASLSPMANTQANGYENHEMGAQHPMTPYGPMNPPMMPYPMGSPESHGAEMGTMMKPHNAALHFLQMKEVLGLTEKQVNELKALRDTYRTENGINEAKLKSAEQELREMMEEDTINLEKAEAKLKEVGALEGPLWSNFIRQLAKIKTIVPKEQMKKMHEMRRSHPMMEME